MTESFTDSNGTRFDNAVLLDTDFFDGISPRNWGDKLRKWVNERASTNSFILPIVDENGNETVLQFARRSDRVTKNGASEHKVLDKLSSSSDNISKLAVIHIDEVISVSEENSPYYTNENNHQWLDENGWLHRNANVINQKNGNIYNLTVDIAKTADGRTVLYATEGKIKKVGNVQVNSLKIKGSGQNSNFTDTIPHDTDTVKRSLSDADGNDVQVLPDGSVTKYSLSTWTPETQARVQGDLIRAGYDEKTVDKWIKDTNGVAAVIAADKSRLDFEAADIQVSGKVFNETKVHTESYNIAARPYLPYINDIVKKAVLLDSFGVDTNKPKSVNSLLMHSLYAVADIGKGPEVIKLYVEEMNNPNTDGTDKRAYQLQDIEKYQLTGKSSQKTVSSISPVTAGTINTVAELFADVKQKDREFQPNPVSAITNSDGTPKVMYHGSPAQFTVFDKKKAKSSGLYGRGFYFTDSETHAGTYGQKYSVYLNIRNPLEAGKATVTREQVKAYLETVAENEDYSIENYGTYDVDAILDNVMGNASRVDAFKVIQDINATAIGDMVEAAELFNTVNGTDFDGIVVSTETVAFRPEQIESATDNIGTFDGTNPDIRYSLTDGDRIAPDSLSALQLQEDIAPPVQSIESAAAVDETESIAPTTVAENATTEDTTEGTTAEETPAAEQEPRITTVKERLTAKLDNRQTELANIKALRDETLRSYDEKIAAAQASLDRKKNKETKIANALKKRIERLKRLKADIVAGYSKRISDIESGVDKISAELEKDHTERDRYEEAIARINATLESDKAALTAEYAARKAELAMNRLSVRSRPSAPLDPVSMKV